MPKTPFYFSPVVETEALEGWGNIILTTAEVERNRTKLLGVLTEAGPMGQGKLMSWGTD